MDNQTDVQKDKQPADGQVSTLCKVIAGTLLVLFTFFAGYFIVAFWPDRLPDPKERKAPLYRYELFHIRLACIPDSPCCAQCIYTGSCSPDTAKTKPAVPAQTRKADATRTSGDTTKRDTAAQTTTASVAFSLDMQSPPADMPRLIHINTILLVLVALGGFAGNMIHIATSFTTFVGDKKFEKSWILWYFVKPFTASTLALGFYFVFRGGFLNTTSDAPNINLYGVMTIAVLTGLFTDIATLKMKEVFEVLFKPKDERTGKRDEEVKINSIDPPVIKRTGVNKFTLTGTNINSIKPVITIGGGTPVADPVIKPTELSFSYVIPADQANAATLSLVIKDDKGKVYLSELLTVQ